MVGGGLAIAGSCMTELQIFSCRSGLHLPCKGPSRAAPEVICRKPAPVSVILAEERLAAVPAFLGHVLEEDPGAVATARTDRRGSSPADNPADSAGERYDGGKRTQEL